MSSTQRENREIALAALQQAESLLRAAELSDHEPDGWSRDFANEIAEALRQGRQEIDKGLPAPPNLGYWLFRTLELSIATDDRHKHLSRAVYEAGAAVDRFSAST